MLHYKQKEGKINVRQVELRKIIRQINFIFILSRIASKSTYFIRKGIQVFFWGVKNERRVQKLLFPEFLS